MENQQAIILNIQMYKSIVHVLHNFDDEKFSECTKNNFSGLIIQRVPFHSATVHYLENIKEGLKEYLIDFKKKLNSKSSESHSTIAHEVYHVVSEIFNDLGIPLGYGNQEAFAYCQGYLIRKIEQEILGLK